MQLTSWTTVILLATAGLLMGQDSLNVTKVGSLQYWGGTGNIEIEGNNAYVITRTGLRIVDISNPASPREVSFYEQYGLKYTDALAVQFPYAFVCYRSSVRVLDISAPSEPAEVGRYETGWIEHFREIAVSGEYAYVLDFSSGVASVLDVSNPATPQLVATIDTLTGLLDLDVEGPVLYLTNYAGLWALDVTDPAHPAILDQHEMYNLKELVVVNGMAYALTHWLSAPSELYLFDVSSPESIVELGNLLFQVPAEDLAVSGTSAYVLSSDSGVCQLHIVDVSDPAEPVESIGPCESAGCQSLALDDSVALIGGRGWDNDLSVISIGDPSPPAQVATIHAAYTINDAAIQANYGYLATGWDGLRIIDISNRTQPAEIGFCDTPGNAQAVAVAGNYVYVADDSSGLRIINIANPTTPVEVGSFEAWATIVDVAISGTHAYLIDDYVDRMLVVDVSDPANPAQVAERNVMPGVYGISVDSNQAVVFAWTEFELFDIQNPDQPTGYGERSDYFLQRAVLSGNLLYLASFYSLNILDISDTAAPVEIVSYDVQGETVDLAVVGNHAYVASTWAGMRVINLSVPSAPVEVGFYGGSLIPERIVAVGNYVYAWADSDPRWMIYDCSVALDAGEPTTPSPHDLTLNPPFPNPFNPSTTISFSLPQTQQVKLAVFDITGRQVAVLADEQYQAGEHRVMFDGAELPSGIYFARLSAGTVDLTQKLMLIR